MLSVIDRAIANSAGLLPHWLVSRIAKRYIAGEGLAGAISTLRKVASEGCSATLNVLGEGVSTAAEAEDMRDLDCRALSAIAAEQLPSGVSVKLTNLGLIVDQELAGFNLEQICRVAAEVKRFVRIDMEESAFTDITLQLAKRMHRAGYRVGTVLQARLRRSEDDAEELSKLGIPLRLVKGIYLEPVSVAYTDQEEIRAAYSARLEQLCKARPYLAIATHDEVLIQRALQLIKETKRTADSYEFQLLLGVRPELRRRLLAAGHRVRIYIPFGKEWLAYSLRRLRENPRMARMVAQALFKFDRARQA